MSGFPEARVRECLGEYFPAWSAWVESLPFRENSDARPTANDGEAVFYHPKAVSFLPPEHIAYYFARELLQIRLAHAARREARNPAVWKKACDAVTDCMLQDAGIDDPGMRPIREDARGLSAEAFYEILLHEIDPDDEQVEHSEKASHGDSPPEQRQNAAGTGDSPNIHSDSSPGRSHNQKRRARQPGRPGDGSSGVLRVIDDPGLASAVRGLSDLLQPSFDIENDWFPGSVVRGGVLPWTMNPVPVVAAEVLLDTSASVDPSLLRAFVRAVKALMQEDAVLRVGCFDTRFYGFHEIHSDRDIDSLSLHGDGGTDFTVAVNAFTGDAVNRVILTDGYAEVPAQRCDCVWVVYGTQKINPPGGRVLYAKPPEEKERYEINFLIT